MNTAERDAFLQSDDPPLCCAVATLNDDGSPRVVSVWYAWDGEAVRLWSKANLTWARNICRDARASIVVFEHARPYRAVYIDGVAEVQVGPYTDLLPAIRPVVARYAQDPEATIASYDDGNDDVAITIVPARIVAKTNSSS